VASRLAANTLMSSGIKVLTVGGNFEATLLIDPFTNFRKDFFQERFVEIGFVLERKAEVFGEPVSFNKTFLEAGATFERPAISDLLIGKDAGKQPAERVVLLHDVGVDIKLARNQDIAVRMALGEKAEPFEHRAVTELVGIVDQQAWLAVFTLHVLCETIGNMLDAAAGRRIIEHVDDRPVDIRDENPALAALGYMREGDVLVVWKLDRLARSLKQLIETVEANAARVDGFQSLTEELNTTTAGGKLTFHIFGALAEFERGMIRERTRAGLTAARTRGKVGGRPRFLYETGLQVARALLADSRIPVTEIAQRLHVNPSTLYRHFPGGRGALQAC